LKFYYSIEQTYFAYKQTTSRLATENTPIKARNELEEGAQQEEEYATFIE
jgi:hypothetical protein